MKKFLAMILALVMVLSLAACGNDDTAGEDTTDSEMSDTEVENGEDVVADPDVDQPADMDAPADMDTPAVNPEQTPDAPVANDTPAVDAPAASGATMGQTLLSAFKGMDMSKGAQAIADELIANPVIEFMGGTVPVEPGLLSGFGNTEITGFSEGVMFGPMMGSIAFVGYIFELEDGANVAAFMETLKSNADPRWNICVEADETLIHNIGNTVFFLMSPNSLGE